jgi:hypothetical protein
MALVKGLSSLAMTNFGLIFLMKFNQRALFGEARGLGRQR